MLFHGIEELTWIHRRSLRHVSEVITRSAVTHNDPQKKKEVVKKFYVLNCWIGGVYDKSDLPSIFKSMKIDPQQLSLQDMRNFQGFQGAKFF
jgi:hypothetical protein